MLDTSRSAPQFQLTYRYTLNHFYAAQRLFMGQRGGRKPLREIAPVFAFWAFLLLAPMAADYFDIPFGADPALLAFLIAAGAFAATWSFRRRREVMEALYASTPMAVHDIQWTGYPEGLEFRCGPLIRYTWDWAAFKTVEETEGYIYLLCTDRYGELVPVSAFRSLEEKVQFLSVVRDNVEKAGTNR